MCNVLSGISVVTPDLFWWLFTWHILSIVLLVIYLCLKHISYRKHIVLLYWFIFIRSAHICLLIGVRVNFTEKLFYMMSWFSLAIFKFLFLPWLLTVWFWCVQMWMFRVYTTWSLLSILNGRLMFFIKFRTF